MHKFGLCFFKNDNNQRQTDVERVVVEGQKNNLGINDRIHLAVKFSSRLKSCDQLFEFVREPHVREQDVLGSFITFLLLQGNKKMVKNVFHYLLGVKTDALSLEDKNQLSQIFSGHDISKIAFGLDEMSLLQYCVYHQDEETIFLLFQRQDISALIRYKDAVGRDLIHYAVMHGDANAVRFWLEQCPDKCSLTDHAGRNILDYAKYYRHQDLQKILVYEKSFLLFQGLEHLNVFKNQLSIS